MKLPVKLVSVLPAAALLLLVGGAVALGAGENIPTPDFTAPADIGGIKGLLSIVKKLVGWMLTFSLILGVVFVIVGGIMYVTSGGNSEKAGTASKMIGFALLGVAVMVLAYALVTVVVSILAPGQEGFITSQ